jgi:glutaminase
MMFLTHCHDNSSLQLLFFAIPGKWDLTWPSSALYNKEMIAKRQEKKMESGIIEGEVEEVLDLYFRHCAIALTTRELSRIAAVFANDGRDLETGEQIVPKQVARVCKTFMVTCGMYNASGEFAIDVGIPAKSGVSVGILAAVPHKLGIGVYGPALDEKGNSMAGVKLLERLANLWQLSNF